MTNLEIATMLSEVEICIEQSKYVEAEQLCHILLDTLDIQRSSMEQEDGYDDSSTSLHSPTAQEFGKPVKEYAYYRARTLNNLCKALQLMQVMPDILPYAEQALDCAIQAEAETEVAIACNNLGRWYQSTAEYHRALEYYQKGLAIYERRENTFGIAQISGNIGLTYSYVSDTHNALPYLQQAVALHEELGNKDGIARNLCNLGTVYKQMSDFPRAMEFTQRALALEEELGNRVGIANNLGNIGLLYVELSDYPRALEYMQKTLAIFQETGNKKGIAGTLSNIGSAYSHLYDHSRALEYYGKALRINEEMSDKAWKINNLSGIGAVYHALSDYSKALEYYQMALELSEEIGKKDSISGIVSRIGRIYGSLSELDKALKYFRKSLEMSRENGHKAGVAGALDTIGKVYLLQKDYSRAKESMQEALVINEDIGFRRGVAGNYRSIGEVYYEQGDYAKALEYFQTSLEIFRENDSVGGVAISLTNIGLLYARSDNADFDTQKAEEYFLQALAMNESIGAKNDVCQCHRALADLYQNTKRWEEANTHFRKFYDLEKEVKSDEVKKKTEQMEHHRQAAEQEKIRAVERAQAAAELAATERALRKFLPEMIVPMAKEGNTVVEHFESVSILFADLVGFTKLSLAIPPIVMIELLNFVFTHFDTIIATHGGHRLRTMGDGYFAICGVPDRREDHVMRFAMAALAMQEDFKLPAAISEHLPPGTEFEIRIGLHCGEVVAGLVGGLKNWQYDVYGDTVNTASRMESHGVPGKIHCTEEFIKKLFMVNGEWLMEEADDFSSLTINHLPLTIISRGEMDIKGKGKMTTYFLEKA